MILLLLHLIATFASSLLLSIPMTAWVMGTQSNSLLDALSAGASIQTTLNKLMAQLPDWIPVAALFASVATGLTALIYGRRFQKRSLASLGLRRSGMGDYLLGLVLGAVLVGAAVAVGVAAGGFRLAAERPALRLGLLLLALLGCALRGFCLELFYRGCFSAAVGARYPVGFALIFTTICAAVLHASDTLLSMYGFNTLLLVLLLGLLAIKRGSLWCGCAVHGLWIFGTDFLFNFAPAGEHSGLRVLDLDTDAFRPLLTGGEAGPQASICVTLVLLAAIAAILALKPQDPAPTPKEEAANNL